MIDAPNTVVTAKTSVEFSFTATMNGSEHRVREHHKRAHAIAQRIADATGSAKRLPPVHVEVLDAAPAHTGLGSGTQLSLAIAEAILRVSPGAMASELAGDLLGMPPRAGELWLAAADRGRRSAVGTHGYLAGGFIAEGLKPSGEHDPLNPLDVRLEMPPAWRVTILLPVATPDDASTVSGEQEQAKFEALRAAAVDCRSALADILTTRLVPAIEDADFASFCAATTEYNQRSGELFASVQGGAYNGAVTTRLITRLRTAGFAGVGQSSWGPGVFVWHPDAQAAAQFEQQWSSAELQVFVARPLSTGRLAELA